MSRTEPSVADRSVADPPTDGDGAAASFAFPRDARLLDKRDYDVAFGDNRRLSDRYWTVLVHTPDRTAGLVGTTDAGQGACSRGARLGLAIAKKRARRAVDRNRIKRVARESFRHVRAALGDRQVVIMNRDAAREADTVELRRALDVLWSRLLRQSGSGAGREKTRGEP